MDGDNDANKHAENIHKIVREFINILILSRNKGVSEYFIIESLLSLLFIIAETFNKESEVASVLPQLHEFLEDNARKKEIEVQRQALAGILEKIDPEDMPRA